MIALIFIRGPLEGWHGLDERRPAACLPLAGRPVLQHIVEHLLSQGVRGFEFFLAHAFGPVQEYFGDGARWGCRFRWHPVKQWEEAYRLVPLIANNPQEIYFWSEAERFPLVNLSEVSIFSSPLWLFALSKQDQPEQNSGSPFGLLWSPTQLENSMWNNPTAFTHKREQLVGAGMSTLPTERYLDVTTASHLLHSQNEILNCASERTMVEARKRSPGIWISRRTTIHSSVKLLPPVYLGPHCKVRTGAVLGPNVAVGANCIIDRDSILRNALVLPHTYVGQKLELIDSIADRNLLLNARLSTCVPIRDRFLLGNLAGSRKRSQPQLI